MKVGIITQPLQNNYGGLLQNFALQQILRDNGYEPVTLDWGPKKRSLWNKLRKWVKSIIFENSTSQYKLNDKELKIISSETSKFIKRYINHSDKSHCSLDFKRETINRELNALIAGSDQVWRPLYSCGHLYDFFFKFAENMDIKRIAYAASFGVDKWEYTLKQTKICADLSKKFSLLTVREESAMDLCKEYLGVNAYQVLDPTMLYDKEFYEAIVNKKKTPRSLGNLFYYILDPSKEKTAIIDVVGKKENLIPFTVLPIYQTENRTRENVKNEIEKCIFPSVEEWLRAFIDAELVICDSFHGCVFSIIFNKPFWVLGNKARGNTRFDSLLNTFGLQNRLISSVDEIDINNSIDWGNVNLIRNQKKKFSVDLLLNALKRKENAQN